MGVGFRIHFSHLRMTISQGEDDPTDFPEVAATKISYVPPEFGSEDFIDLYSVIFPVIDSPIGEWWQRKMMIMKKENCFLYRGVDD